MSEGLRRDAWTDVYQDRSPTRVRITEARLTSDDPAGEGRSAPTPRDIGAAVAEAQEQAQALKEAVSQAEAILEGCRELLDSLRAILTYPSAYGWEKDICHLSERPALETPPPAGAGPKTAPSMGSGRKAS